jgi:hypothetical protein
MQQQATIERLKISEAGWIYARNLAHQEVGWLKKELAEANRKLYVYQHGVSPELAYTKSPTMVYCTRDNGKTWGWQQTNTCEQKEKR